MNLIPNQVITNPNNNSDYPFFTSNSIFIFIGIIFFVDGEEEDNSIVTRRLIDGTVDVKSNSDAEAGTCQAPQAKIYTKDYWQFYFNVDKNQIAERIKASFDLRKGEIFRLIETKTDLYGPFWIVTTIVILIFILSSIADLVTHGEVYEGVLVCVFVNVVIFL
jgi:hypothetical protein